MPDTLLLHCQHSLGMGHLARALVLADALARRFRVVLMSGGRLPEGISHAAGVEIVQLPALAMDPDGALVSEDPRRSVEAVLAERREILLRALRELRPRVLLVELFPFGRKKLAPELVPLLEAARAVPRPPLVLCSLRDILVTGRRDQQAHDDRAASLANRLLDAVLVHADARVARLEDSFLPSTPIAVPVHYTGYVARRSAAPRPGEGREDRVLISAGGGRAGSMLLRTALAAQPLLWQRDRLPMRVVAGPYLEAAGWHALQRAARLLPGVDLLRSVPDLSAELVRASASVSQCGYNTALDLLRTRVPALVIPYRAPGQDEQTVRARRLAGLGALCVLDPEELHPARLAQEIRKLADWRPRKLALDLEGAARTLLTVERMLDEHALQAASPGAPEPEARGG